MSALAPCRSYGGDEEEDDEEEAIYIDQPCTSVAQAIVNLKACLPLFVLIAKDEQVGRAYWQRALDGLTSLPLPYLSINAEEVVLMGDEFKEYNETIRCALSGEPGAIEFLMDLSAYEDSVAPYTPEEFDSIAGERDEARNGNSIALDAGIYC